MYKTREEWLDNAVKKLAPLFKDHGKLPEKIHAIVSFPDKKNHHSILGVCYPPTFSKDKGTYIFITPGQGKGEEVRILDILVHELIHSINFAVKQKGHGKCFSKIAKAVGLEGKMTATVASKELKAKLEAIAKELGEFPHVAMVTPFKKNRHLVNGGSVRLWDLAIPGYKCYVFKSWLKQYGPPLSMKTKKPLTLEDGTDVMSLFDDEDSEGEGE